jgi:hypothetical protein
VKNHNITSEVVHVTPALAAKWLEVNVSNRTFSESTCKGYVDAMRREEWKLNGEPLILFSNGKLGNGQHRLTAVTRTGLSQYFVVTRGIDADTFGTMDGGKRRTSADVLGMAGEKSSHHLAAAIRTCIFYGYRQPGAMSSNTATSAQVSEFLADNPGIRDWLNHCKTNIDSRLCPASLLGYIYLASLRTPSHILKDFLVKLFSGVGLQKGDPALLLRLRLTAVGSSRVVATARDALIVKALNAHILGSKIGQLKWTTGETFPTLASLP